MSVSQEELREILKIIRQLEKVIEKALRTEEEKNEERIRKQLEASGISVTDVEMEPTYKEEFNF